MWNFAWKLFINYICIIILLWRTMVEQKFPLQIWKSFRPHKNRWEEAVLPVGGGPGRAHDRHHHRQAEEHPTDALVHPGVRPSLRGRRQDGRPQERHPLCHVLLHFRSPSFFLCPPIPVRHLHSRAGSPVLPTLGYRDGRGLPRGVALHRQQKDGDCERDRSSGREAEVQEGQGEMVNWC